MKEYKKKKMIETSFEKTKREFDSRAVLLVGFHNLGFQRMQWKRLFFFFFFVSLLAYTSQYGEAFFGQPLRGRNPLVNPSTATQAKRTNSRNRPYRLRST